MPDTYGVEEMSEEEQLGSLLPLAYSIAHLYERMWGQPKGEFESAALMGAWDAVQRWNPDAGASLYTYARFRIRGEVIDWHRTERQQRGGSRREDKRNLTYCVDFNDLGRDGDGISTEAATIEKMEQGRTYEKGYSVIDNLDVLKHLKARMDEKEWDILVRCVCNEEFMWKVGKSYGVSESRICQILPQALKHARKILERGDEEVRMKVTPAQREADKERVWLSQLTDEEVRAARSAG